MENLSSSLELVLCSQASRDSHFLGGTLTSLPTSFYTQFRPQYETKLGGLWASHLRSESPLTLGNTTLALNSSQAVGKADTVSLAGKNVLGTSEFCAQTLGASQNVFTCPRSSACLPCDALKFLRPCFPLFLVSECSEARSGLWNRRISVWKRGMAFLVQ